MKKQLLLFIVVLFVASSTFAQHLLFKKLYSTNGPSNQASGILQQPNGDLIVTGIRSVPIGGSQYIANIIVLRIKSNGDTIWTKEIGTTTDRELANGVTQLPNGNIVIVGSINLPPNGLSDAFIVCIDTAGNTLWQKKYGGSQSELATDAVFDGEHIIVCGMTDSYGAGDNDSWLLKLNQSGDTVWTKTYGGTLVDDAWGIVVAHDAYYFTGGTYSYANGQFDDAWIVKTDTAGNKLWHKTYGEKDKVDWAWGITPSVSNGVVDGLVFTGVKDTELNQPNSSYGSMHLVKIDTSGAIVWDKSISNTGGTNWRREGFDIKRFESGGYIISGFKLEPSIQSQQFYVVKTDDVGTVLWDTAFGTSDSNYYANALTITSDGGWAVTGSVFNFAQQMRYIYVAKFSPNNVSVEHFDFKKAIDIYPNPIVGNEVNIIAGNDVQVNRVEVVSIDGQVLQDVNFQQANTKYTIPIERSGVFILNIYTDKGITRRKITSIK